MTYFYRMQLCFKFYSLRRKPLYIEGFLQDQFMEPKLIFSGIFCPIEIIFPVRGVQTMSKMTAILSSVKLSSVIKMVWYGQQKTQTGRWNKIENPKIDQYKYIQLIFQKGKKTKQRRKIAFYFSTGVIGHLHAKKRSLNKGLTLFTKRNSKNIIHLNIKHKTIKLQKITYNKTQMALGIVMTFQI